MTIGITSLGRVRLLAGVLLGLLLISEAADAQSTSTSAKMVEAFKYECIDVPAIRSHEELGLRGWKPFAEARMDPFGVVYRSYQRSTAPNDPHSNLTLEISWANGGRRACTVIASWPSKSEIVATLNASVALREPVSAISAGIEITSWMLPTYNGPATVELRVPRYTAQPGRSLTLTLR